MNDFVRPTAVSPSDELQTAVQQELASLWETRGKFVKGQRASIIKYDDNGERMVSLREAVLVCVIRFDKSGP